MKIIVIGGSGLIGTKLVRALREQGHEAVAASPKSGVNAFTGEGLAPALEGAAAVIDVSNAPSWEAAAVMKFFLTSTHNLLDAEAAAGVQHHIALSVVGAERMPGNTYMPAKIAQEAAIQDGPIPFPARSMEPFVCRRSIFSRSPRTTWPRFWPALPSRYR